MDEERGGAVCEGVPINRPDSDAGSLAGKGSVCASQDGPLRCVNPTPPGPSIRKASLSKCVGSSIKEASSVVDGAVDTVEGVVATERAPRAFGSAWGFSLALSAGLGTLESIECAVVLSSSWSLRSFVRR